MKRDEIISRAIKEGIFEQDGFRYCCHTYWEFGNNITHEIVRINLRELNRHYRNGGSADDFTGIEKYALLVEEVK